MSKKRPKVFPYHIVLTRKHGETWWRGEFVGENEPLDKFLEASKTASELARRYAESGGYAEVRHVISAVESRWGPADAGGLFNQQPGLHHVNREGEAANNDAST